MENIMRWRIRVDIDWVYRACGTEVLWSVSWLTYVQLRLNRLIDIVHSYLTTELEVSYIIMA